MGTLTALAVLCGAAVAAGVWLIVAGLRGTRNPGTPVLQRWRAHADRAVMIRLGLGVSAFLVALALTGWPVAALLIGALSALLPSMIGGRTLREQQLAKIEAVATWAEMLRDTVAAGSGLSEALRVTAAVAPAPLRLAVEGLNVRMERGDLVTALRWFGNEVADPMADLVVAALTMAATEQARRLGDLLGSLAAATREQAAMRLRVEASRARTRTVSAAVASIAAASAVGFLMFDRSYLQPYDTATGQLVLAGVGGCFGAAFWLLARMGRIPSPPRLTLGKDGWAG